MIINLIKKIKQDSWDLYLNKYVLSFLFFGFSAGIPLALTAATLTNRLSGLGVSKISIGLFAAVAMPYSLKFIWSFAVDFFKIPYLTNKMGLRRSWMLVIQILLIVFIILLGSNDPTQNLWLTAVLAICVSFLSASQDIVIDAYRIEILKEEQLAAGTAMYVYGYRIALLISGGGALILSDHLSWQAVYTIMGLFMVIGIITVLLSKEAKRPKIADVALYEFFSKKVWEPFQEFTTRRNWFLILLFIILYKYPDAFLGAMTSDFYVSMGFTNTEIGTFVKTFGLIMTLIGTFLGGVLFYKLGVMRSLLVSAVLQMASNLVYIIQVYAGADTNILMVVIAVENLTGALGSVVIISYLSSLCNISFTATQYALLSSCATLGRAGLSTPSGWIVEQLGWIPFFITSTLIGIPGVILLYIMMYKKIIKPA